MKRNKNIQLYLVYLGIFGVIFILNCLTHRSIGDDYLYSFMWEGHSMYEPLSENARRISSFSDIAVSTYSYFMTWGGRVVAQALAMFFLWMPRMVFNVAISLTTVLLVLCIQWIARGGKITRNLSAKEAALIFFCLWAFQTNFVGVFIWTDGSCNYLFPMIFLLLFMLPYIRHYINDGKDVEISYRPCTMFFLGVLAGNSNENTVCWLVLFSVFYIFYSYRKGIGKLWLLTGMLGLIIGYVILLLAPGNFLRVLDSHENLNNFMITNQKLLVLWFGIMAQSMLWFYLWKAFRKREDLEQGKISKKYLRLSYWFIINSSLFDIIMLFAPEFPNRSLFPGLIFMIIAVFTIAHLSKKESIYVLDRKNIKWNYLLAIIYFSFTFFTTTWWYVCEYYYEEELLQRVDQFKGRNEVLCIEKDPPNDGIFWTYLTGVHKYAYGLSEDENNWRNVAFARFHDLKGVRLVKE